MSESPMRRRALVAAAALAVAGAGALAAPSAAAPPGKGKPQPRPDFTLTILHTNDGESALLPRSIDVDGNRTIEPAEVDNFGGVARFATIVERETKAATSGRPPAGYAGKRGSLLISSGDNFLAGPQLSASIDQDGPFYDALAMRLMGFDASAIGNHEFDFGPALLAEFVEAFEDEVPFVSANLDFTGEPVLQAQADDGSIVESVVVRERGERIGIIGLTTPILAGISSPGDVVASPELADITNAQVDVLEDAGVDKIIITSHLQDIGEELALVEQIRGVDVVIAGGGGELLAKPDDLLVPGDSRDAQYADYPQVATDLDGNDVPVVTTIGGWKYVGKLVVHFDRNGEVVGWDEDASGVVRVSGVSPDAVPFDAEMQQKVVEPVAAYVEELKQTVVADTDVVLDGERPEVRTMETNLANVLVDGMLWEADRQAAAVGGVQPQMAIMNGGGIRIEGDIPEGPISEFDTFSVAPFFNLISVLPDVPSTTMKEVLERGLSSYPSAQGAFVHVAGAEYTFDPTGTAQTARVGADGNPEITQAGDRVENLVLDDGTVVIADGVPQPGVTVDVALNNFSALGGDLYTFVLLPQPLEVYPVTYQQALRNYLQEPGGLGGDVTAAQYPRGGEGRITIEP